MINTCNGVLNGFPSDPLPFSSLPCFSDVYAIGPSKLCKKNFKKFKFNNSKYYLRIEQAVSCSIGASFEVAIC